MSKSIYGYFSSPEDVIPIYDPGFDVHCPICDLSVGRHTTDSPIKTISVMLERDGIFTGDIRSYFYRVHRVCYDGLDEEQESMLDWQIIDSIAQSRESN